MEVVRLIFVLLGGLVALPLTIYCIAVRKRECPARYFSYFLSIISLGLLIAGFILALTRNYACGWVSFGVNCGGLVVSLLNTLICATYLKNSWSYSPSNNTTPQFNNTATVSSEKTYVSHEEKPANTMNYIEELKQLKELLDMEAITQEEFDKKKKEILERR